jgi:hypothetical protein
MTYHKIVRRKKIKVSLMEGDICVRWMLWSHQGDEKSFFSSHPVG